MTKHYYRVNFDPMIWDQLGKIAERQNIGRQDLISAIINQYVNNDLYAKTQPAMLDAFEVLTKRIEENTKLIRYQTELVNLVKELLLMMVNYDDTEEGITEAELLDNDELNGEK